jgi:dUTP pyrophosphatase
MKVRYKKLSEEAVTPRYSREGDAGLDLVAIDQKIIIAKGKVQHMYSTGIALEIPHGYVGLIFPRSSICNKGERLSNCVGVIDSNYRGEITFVFDVIDPTSSYKIGDRIGQIIIMPYPEIELEESDVLSDSNRGEEGFGSSGA